MNNGLTKEERIVDRRVRFLWRIITRLARPFVGLFYNYRGKKAPKIKGPFILLSNHNTNLDSVLIGICFPRNQMYFIASEQFFRRGLYTRFLKFVFAPISKIKGASDREPVMKALRYIRAGKNIALFPEGNRSFNGKTGEIEEATGKLVKVSHATLVTFKIEGGYFTFPRWGFGFRKGRMNGGVVNVYTPEQLEKMSVSEITDVIRKDLEENAYERQKLFPIRFRGKNLAYGMESAIFACPHCSSINKIKTKGNRVFCTECNYGTEIDEYGYFNEDFSFQTVTQWDEWQNAFLEDYVQKFNDLDKPMFQDENFVLITIGADHVSKFLGRGNFVMYKDRFEFIPMIRQKIVFPIESIPDVSIFGKSIFNFSDNEGVHYEMRADNIVNMRKYLHAWKMLRSNN